MRGHLNWLLSVLAALILTACLLDGTEPDSEDKFGIIDTSNIESWSAEADELDETYESRVQLDECEGDCDNNSDCKGDLQCFQRDRNGPRPPGCPNVRTGSRTDFCYCPFNSCNDDGNYGDVQLDECEGDCDNNSDCKGDLQCFQRDENGPRPPGCPNVRTGSRTDFCYCPFNSCNDDRNIEDEYDFGELSDRAVLALADRFEDLEGHENWPQRPRRGATITDSFSNKFSLGVGIKYNLFGSELENTITAKFNVGYNQSITLIRHAPTGTESILIRDDEGNVAFNYEEGVDFVAICSWSTEVKTALEWTGKIAIFGNGVKDETEIARVVETNLISYFYNVVEGDTIASLRSRCVEEFEGNYRQSLIDEQRLWIEALLGFDENAQDTYLNLAARAARQGPQLEGFEYRDQTFNIPQAEWSVEGQRYTITGHITRHRKVAAVVPWPGKDIHYRFVFEEGNLIEKEITDEASEEVAAELVEIIAEEVYLYAREEF